MEPNMVFYLKSSKKFHMYIFSFFLLEKKNPQTYLKKNSYTPEGMLIKHKIK